MASEYAHKEALNTTYIGYEKAIKENKNEELKNQLLEIMIQCASFNPSTTLGKVQGEYPVSSAMKALHKNNQIKNDVG